MLGARWLTTPSLEYDEHPKREGTIVVVVLVLLVAVALVLAGAESVGTARLVMAALVGAFAAGFGLLEVEREAVRRALKRLPQPEEQRRAERRDALIAWYDASAFTAKRRARYTSLVLAALLISLLVQKDEAPGGGRGASTANTTTDAETQTAVLLALAVLVGTCAVVIALEWWARARRGPDVLEGHSSLRRLLGSIIIAVIVCALLAALLLSG